MRWEDIPGWLDYRDAQEEVVAHFGGGVLVEVGCYLGRSLCSLADLVRKSGKPLRVVGVDTCTGSGVERPHGDEPRDHHCHAVNSGGGTFAGALHRNVLGCGFADLVHLIVGPSVEAAGFFPFRGCDFVFLDARHDEESLAADIAAWLPRVRPGGWLAGDDLSPVWPGVRAALDRMLPGKWRPWSHDSWRHVVPG